MPLFEELLYKPSILVFRYFKLLGFACQNARVLTVQVLLDVFEAQVFIYLLVSFNQSILAFLVVLEFFSVVVTVLLVIPQGLFLHMGYVIA